MNYSTPEQSDLQAGRIAKFLPVGRRNAISAKQLAALCGMTRDELRHGIEAERRRGIPILADSNPLRPGFFLPENPGDIAWYVSSLRRRADEIRKTAECVEKGGQADG